MNFLKGLGMNKKEKDTVLQAINIVEELSWLLDNKKIKILKDAPQLMRNTLSEDKNISNTEEHKKELIGVLPNLLLDEDLFKTNADIAEFSESVLGISLPRHTKSSRFELIGRIICSVPTLATNKINSLMNALGLLDLNKEKIKSNKNIQDNFSWNDTIQQLSMM